MNKIRKLKTLYQHISIFLNSGQEYSEWLNSNEPEMKANHFFCTYKKLNLNKSLYRVKSV